MGILAQMRGNIPRGREASFRVISSVYILLLLTPPVPDNTD